MATSEEKDGDTTINEEGSWPIIDPDWVVSELKKLAPGDCPSGRPFYRSYGKWASLKIDQRNKTVQPVLQ